MEKALNTIQRPKRALPVNTSRRNPPKTPKTAHCIDQTPFEKYIICESKTPRKEPYRLSNPMETPPKTA